MTRSPKKSQTMGNQHQKQKYHPIKTNDHEMDDFHENNKSLINNNDKAFDFTSASDYKSIFTYTNQSLKRQNHFEIDSETKSLNGPEKFVNFIIIGIFYVLVIVLFPFSLILCLKKVKENERVVVYRLGRLISPEYKPGYCILFPLIDSYQRLTVVQKEFSILNLQILNYENTIVDTSTQIRYIINDVIKMTNSIQDLNSSLKSIARSILISSISKKDTSKLENEIYYLKQDFKNNMNTMVLKWGVEIVEVEITINSIVRDENESGEDPALKTIKSVFMSLFNRDSSDDTKPKTSNSVQSGQLPTEIMNLFQGMMPTIIPNEANSSSSFLNLNLNNTQATGSSSGNNSENLPFKLLKLLQPLINENLIREIQTVYEFHIKSKQNAKNDMEEKFDIFFLDLKTLPNGNMGVGPCLFSKVDCVIKLSDEDLSDLLTDNLKPFTAYMSGRIEIEGDLQDVFKLKKLIKNVTAAMGANKII